MKRNAEYQEAKDRVKISHFTEKGHDINGVMHVGTNYGYEFQYYRQMGIEYFCGFEPLPLGIAEFVKNYPVLATGKEFFFPFGLGNENINLSLKQATGDGQDSTFLDPIEPIIFVDEVVVKVKRFQDLMIETYPLIPIDQFDCLVVDVQGMELEVLKGMGSYLLKFSYLNIECSRDLKYGGSNTAQEIIDYLFSKGFRQDSPIEEHNDIMFIRSNI